MPSSASRLWISLFAAAAAVATPASAAVLVAEEGRAAVPVVLARGASLSERTAARELVEHLEQVTGARFTLATEGTGDLDGAAILVGPTRRAAALGSGTPDGPEQWRVRTEGDSLVLDGGRPRGTLYAVYHFLEDVVGVRWWTPESSFVPRIGRLELPELRLEGEPAFSYRDVHGLDGSVEFSARNRHNGDRSHLPAAFGGREAYGPPGHAHDFYVYVPPEEFFADHPEFFSEVDGVRTDRRAQLCLTNPELQELVGRRLEGFIAQGTADAEERGESPPRLYPFSQGDWGGACTCPACAEVDRREGGHAGSLVEMLNSMGERIRESHPDVLIDTLAYHYTFPAPREAKLVPNVVVRLSALQRRDFSKPVTHRRHRSYRRAIDEWRRVTSHLRIWDYSVTFGEGAELPLSNLPILAEDLRYYLDHGVEGVFIQHDPPIRADMRDLKVWVLLKLLEEPSREPDALVREFTDGYYGPAAPAIRDYLVLLEGALARRPARIGYPALAEQYRYIDPRFLREAQAIFDRAEVAVAGSAELLDRVRFARLGLDRATLLRWRDKLRRPAASGPALDPETVAQRYWETALDRIEGRFGEVRGARLKRQVATEIGETMISLGYEPPEAKRPAVEELE
jgi:hypothetical protein